MKTPYGTIRALATASTICFAAIGCGAAALADDGEKPEAVIDNSSLIPKIVDDKDVRMETGGANSPACPDWVKSLIVAETSVENATDEKTFKGMPKVLDHLAETGVNGLWLTPLNDGRHYWNYGLHTLNQDLTGEPDQKEGWKRVKEFVDEAHKRNIRVFFDVISWGVHEDAPLHKEKPEWFGDYIKKYRGWAFDWKNAELNAWFADRLVEMLEKSGADGLRCDSAPWYAGYEPYRVARERMMKNGRKIIMISEHACARKGVFVFDQRAFCDGKDTLSNSDGILASKNIVDFVKSGDEQGAADMKTQSGGGERFYAYQLSSHDSQFYTAKGSLVAFGYQMLFSPFIPLWIMGEEWNNPYTREAPPNWLYANAVNWRKLDENRAFYERVKRLIRVRRQYPEIFEYFPADHRAANICKVRTDHPELYQAYARYKDGEAILIVPNNGKEDASFQITIPFKEAELSQSAQFEVKDLLAEKELASGTPAKLQSFKAEIPKDGIGLFLVVSQK